MHMAIILLLGARFLMNPSQKQVAATPKPLLPKIVAGEAGAVDACIKRYGGMVWSAAKQFLGQAADAEEVVQEIFADLWAKSSRFNPDQGSEGAWVMMVTRRRLIDRIRHESRRVQPDELERDQQVSPSGLDVDDLEDVARARAAMKTLKPEEQQVLELVLTQGLSHQAVAEQLKLPLGTVKTHARRGILAVRERLGVKLEGVAGGSN